MDCHCQFLAFVIIPSAFALTMYQRIPLSVESPDRVNLELVQISPSADHEESNDEFLPDS